MSEAKRRGRFADFLIRLVKEKPVGILYGVIILLLIFVAIFADVLAPYDHYKMHLLDRLKGSSAQHLLGTDHLGRDLLSRLIFGARISLLVGLTATTINVVVAALIGVISGFIGGKVDLAVQRFVDAWMAFPGLLLLLTIMSIVGQGLLQILVNPNAGEDGRCVSQSQFDFTVITFDPWLGCIKDWDFRTPYVPLLLDRVHICLSNQPFLLLKGGSGFGGFNLGVHHRVLVSRAVPYLSRVNPVH